MKLIQKLIEDAAAGAVSAGGGDVAGFATPLFARLTKRELPTKIKIERKKKKPKNVKTNTLSVKEAYNKLMEFDDAHRRGQSTYDNTEVISKLKSIENKNSVNKNESQAFVLDDDDGNSVKIWVKADQAANFENALNAFLSDNLRDDKHGAPEIAEILFKLKNNFDIIDVKWPDVEEDEENQEVTLAGDQEGGQEGAEGELGDELGGEEGLDLGNAEGDLGGTGEEDVKSLLTQVIDMMKADAEARKAEAAARAAEAKTKEVNLANQHLENRVKQEERILDMEAYEKKQKEAEKEAKRLAKLAKWQHDLEKEEGVSFDDNVEGPSVDTIQGAQEEEELRRPAPTKKQPANKGSSIRGRVNPADVANFILNRVK